MRELLRKEQRQNKNAKNKQICYLRPLKLQIWQKIYTFQGWGEGSNNWLNQELWFEKQSIAFKSQFKQNKRKLTKNVTTVRKEYQEQRYS